MDQLPQELLDSLAFILAIYSASLVLILAYALFSYLATGVSLFRMMTASGVPNPWMAWVPFCSTYALGNLADNYNLICEAKPTTYAKKLLAWHIVTTALSQPILLVLYAMKPDTSPSPDFWLLVLGYITAVVVYTVFYSISLYKIYRLFAPENAVGLLVLSILVGVAVPLILLVMSRRQPYLPYTEEESDGTYGDMPRENSAF